MRSNLLRFFAVIAVIFACVAASVLYDDEDSSLNGSIIGSQGISRVYLHRNGVHDASAQPAFATSIRSLRDQASTRFGVRIDSFFDEAGNVVNALDAVFDASPLYAAQYGEAFRQPRRKDDNCNMKGICGD